MNDENTNLDLLDLDGDTSDSLPEVAFATPRPRKPWLLLGIGLVVIALATYVIVRTVSGGSSSSVEIDLDAAPEVVVDGGAPMGGPMPDANPQPLPMPGPMMPQPQAQPVMVQPVAEAPKPAPVAKPAPIAENEPNVRVVEEDRYLVVGSEPLDARRAARTAAAVEQQFRSRQLFFAAVHVHHRLFGRALPAYAVFERRGLFFVRHLLQTP